MNDIKEIAIGNNRLNIVKYICRNSEQSLTGYAPTLFPAEDAIYYREWIIPTRDSLVIYSRCDQENELQTPIILSPPVQISTLKSVCAGYADQATLSPYFYKRSSDDQATSYVQFDICLGMVHIYELKQSHYTFDFRLTNPEPLSSEVLPEAKELDMSYVREALKRI